jgi:hypothetical protein
MWTNFINWREEKKVDRIAEMDVGDAAKYQHILPETYYGKDKKGRPVFIQSYKHFDLKDILSVDGG